MDYRIEGLDPTPFIPLYGLPDLELGAAGVVRMSADSKPGYPDRIELRDADPGQSVLLLNFEHLPVAGPYRSRHAIFVREGAEKRFAEFNTIPEVMRPRLMSLRAFDAKGNMLDADVIDGTRVEDLIEKLFQNIAVDYLHAHYAKRGCYCAVIRRA